jgi:hypothetical protein
MNAGIESRIKESSRDFLHVVWPEIGKDFDGVEPVEVASSDSVASQLDKRAGIDNWLLLSNGIVMGLASRVQWPQQHRSFDTFTVRVRSRGGGITEYDKRLLEMQTPGAITPYYWCHSYVACAERRPAGQHSLCTVDNHAFISAAVVQTTKLIWAVRMGMGNEAPPNGDGSQMYVVRWPRLMDAGCKVRIWRADQDDQPALWEG